MTATVGLAADYEIFGDFMSVATGENHYSVERLDHKNRKLHHCTAILDAETKQLTGQCAGKERNFQGRISNVFGGVPVFGSWKIDQTTGKTEFCIADTAQCVDATPQ